MLSSKRKGFFFEASEFSYYGATATAFEPPLTVHEFMLLPASEEKQMLSIIEGMGSGKGKRRMVQGNCSLYPESRFICRGTIDSKKLKDPSYLSDKLKSEFQVNSEKNAVRLLHPDLGTEVDLENSFTRNILYCGSETEELSTLQNRLIEIGIYPRSMEIGSLSCLGGLIDYLNWKNITTPVLSVEIQGNFSHIFIVSQKGLLLAKKVGHGINSMIPMLQKELGLEDAEAAKKLLFSQTLDFEDIGQRLLRKLMHELQASTGFFEVQTGVSVTMCFAPIIPEGFGWILESLLGSLGVDTLEIDLAGWLEHQEILLSEEVASQVDGNRDFRFFTSLGKYSSRESNEDST
ncbi:MAG: hypothetical protein O7C75_21940 [Verrucomicrobia bacterium]|nr:hypothetical protein [Verrucomicrobiota bacterium]